MPSPAPGPRVLHLAGSPTNTLLDDVSRLYAQDCLAATRSWHDPIVAHVGAGGAWRLAASLDDDDLGRAAPMAPSDALATLGRAGIDVVLPQMFCRPGMTAYRAMWEVLGVPHVGNPAAVMAIGADKAQTRALLAAAGVPVPNGRSFRRGERVRVDPPVVVKPVDADNSLGVSLVRDRRDLDAALHLAWSVSERALVDTYLEAGREVRCGVLDLDGELVALPLEEYRLDPGAPVRLQADKLGRSAAGDLRLRAKTADAAWIVDASDPITAPVQSVARACHLALGCRDHSLWDLRVDPEGRPWVLEASLYCSFAHQSVLVMMAAAAGIALEQLWTASLRQARGRRG